MNIIIPMAGAGKRFEIAGFPDPKPFIDIHGETMIYRAVTSLCMPDATYIMVAQQEHLDQGYDLKKIMERTGLKYKIVTINGITGGAAETCLAAKEFVDNDDDLIITNSDMMLVWYPHRFLKYVADNPDIDGVVSTVTTDHPNYSYVKLVDGWAVEFAEKRVISSRGLTGFHYWRHGKDFVYSAEELIRQDITTNGEYYISLTYNMLLPEKKITEYRLDSSCEKQIVLGTPWELHQYMNHQQ